MMKLYTIIEKLLNGHGCSFKYKYHYYCPGCGATRALYELLHFNITSSYLSNPIVITLIIYGLFLFVLRIFENRHDKRNHRNYKLRAKISLGVLLFWLLFAVFRNLLLMYCGYDYLGDIA